MLCSTVCMRGAEGVACTIWYNANDHALTRVYANPVFCGTLEPLGECKEGGLPKKKTLYDFGGQN